MTALKKYDRLESGGLWRADADAQRRDVTVSFGNSTLVIADPAGRPLTHWSLPAVSRLNEGERPAVFAADDTAVETLEIEDAYMIDAIEKVRKTLLKSRPKPGRLRHSITAGIIAALAGLAIFWFPGAARQQTLSVVPQSKRVEIGAAILGHMQANVGQRCQSDLGQRALARLNTRLLGPDSLGQIIVLPRNMQSAIALPGGIIAIDQDHVERTDDPAVAAGFVLTAHARRIDTDPLAPILDAAGLRATLRLLTTGDIPPAHLETYADQLIGNRLPQASADTLIATFDFAAIPTAPFAAASAVLGEPMTFLETHDTQVAETPPILSDSDWIGLQGICDS